jgi:hypothetical protein
MRFVRTQVVVGLFIGLLSGCVNNVPRITSEEEKRIKEQLEAESKQWQEKQQARVE